MKNQDSLWYKNMNLIWILNPSILKCKWGKKRKTGNVFLSNYLLIPTLKRDIAFRQNSTFLENYVAVIYGLKCFYYA